MKCFVFMMFFACSVTLYSQSRLVDNIGESYKELYSNTKQEYYIQSSEYEILNTKNFDLYIAKDEDYSKGFGDPILGSSRKIILRQAFEDLSQLINSYGRARILINSVNDIKASYLAAGSSFYLIEDNQPICLKSGLVLKTLASQKDAYIMTNYEGNFHGKLRVNFAFDFNLDLFSNSFPNFDLYSVILHEAMHIIDFGSAVQADLTSRYKGTSIGFFHVFDNYLYYIESGANAVKLLDRTDCLGIDINPEFKVKYLTADCKLDKQIIFITPYGDSIPIFSPSVFKSGSSLSHLDNLCINENNLMVANIDKGFYKRFPSEYEVKILASIGLPVSDYFGNPGTDRYMEYDVSNVTCSAIDDIIVDTIIVGEYYNLSYFDIIKNDILPETEICLELINNLDNIEISTYNLSTTNPIAKIKLLDLKEPVLSLRYKYKNNAFSNEGIIRINVEHSNFNDCSDNLSGNYVCNGDFENSINNYKSRTDGLVFNTGIDFTQGWRGRIFNIMPKQYNNLILPFYGRGNPGFPSLSLQFIVCWKDTCSLSSFRVPDSYSKSFDNNFFSTFWWGYSYNPDYLASNQPGWYLSNSYLYQKLILPKKKEYILEFWINNCYNFKSNCGYKNECASQYIHHNYSIQEKIIVYLDNENPCFELQPTPEDDRNRILFNKINNYHGEKLLFNEKVRPNEWVHIKSQPFRVDEFAEDSLYLFFGGDFNSIADSLYSCFATYIDNVVIREASAGVTLLADNTSPCLGSQLQYTAKIWKDIPDDGKSLDISTDFPPELIYIDGDFVQKNGKLTRHLLPKDFNDSGIVYLKINARVPNDLLLAGKKISFEVYPDDVPREKRASLGNTKIVIIPTYNNLTIEKSFPDTVCEGSVIRMKLKILNHSKEILKRTLLFDNYFGNIDLVEYKDSVNKLDYSVYKINGTDFSTLESSDYLYYYNYKGVTLSGLMLYPPIDENSTDNLVTVEYDFIAKPGVDKLYFRTEIDQWGEGCGLISNLDSIVIVRSAMVRTLPKDTIACDEVILSTGYPEFFNLWTDGDKSATKTIRKSGKYTVAIANNYGCILYDTANVRIIQSPIKIILKDSLKTLNAGSDFSIGMKVLIPLEYLGQGLDISYKVKIRKNQIQMSNSQFTELIEDNGDYAIYRLTQRWLINSSLFSIEDNMYVINIQQQFKTSDASDLESDIEVFALQYNACDYNYSSSKCKIITNSFDDGINRLGIANGLKLTNVYPNPVSNKTIVEFSIPNDGIFELYVVDAIGRKSNFSYINSLGNGSYSIPLDFSELYDGYYLLVLEQNNKIASRMITVIK